MEEYSLDFFEIINVDQELENFKYQGFDYEAVKKKIESQLSKELIAKCILWYVSRGTKISGKAEQTSSAAAKEFFAVIKQKGVKETATGKDHGVITIARIVLIYPFLTMLAMANHGSPVCRVDSVPRGFSFPAAASLIPKERNDLFESHVKWQLAFSQTIRSTQSEADVRKFAEISWNSSRVPNDMKKKAIKDFWK